MSIPPPHDPANAASPAAERRAVVIVNNLAPRAYALDWSEVCSRSLGPGVAVKVVRVSGFEAVRQAAQEAAAAGAWLVVSVGGDGTLNSVINGVGDHPTLVTTLPGGTANSFAYQLGLSDDLAAGAAALGTFTPVQFDSMRVNGVRFCLVMSAGWLADAILAYNRFRSGGSWFGRVLSRLLGPFVYVFFMFWGLRNLERIGSPMSVRYLDAKDNEWKSLEVDMSWMMITGPSASGGKGELKLVPSSDMADGVIELLYMKKGQNVRGSLIKSLTAMQKGTLMDMPEISFVQARKMEVRFRRPTEVIVDGEPLAPSDVYHVDVTPAQFRLFGPPGKRPGTSR